MKMLNFHSYRRMLLDSDLEGAKRYIKNEVLGLGGGRKRSEFKKPKNATWIVLDIKRDFHPAVLGDAHHLPFKENAFDCVKCTELLEHTEEPEKAVKEFSRVLRSRGFLMSTPDAFIFYICPSVGEIND